MTQVGRKEVDFQWYKWVSNQQIHNVELAKKMQTYWSSVLFGE